MRPRAAVTVQHGGQRQTYQLEQDEFGHLSRRLVKRSEAIVRRILADNSFGWAHVDVLLTTGGSSRMPMVRNSLQKLSGRTLNQTLSPDQSIAHGAAYYSGMLLSNQKYARTVFSSQASERLSRLQQQAVNARSLGIMVRDVQTEKRVPHYLIPPNTALPTAKTHIFGTVVDNQTTVRVRIVESGAGPDRPFMELGDCRITGLPSGLKEGSQVEVTISYDAQARVHVSARELQSNLSAEVEILRQENFAGQLQNSVPAPDRVSQMPEQRVDSVDDGAKSDTGEMLLRCGDCGRALNSDGECDVCVSDSQALRSWAEIEEAADSQSASAPAQEANRSRSRKATPEDEFWDLVDDV